MKLTKTDFYSKRCDGYSHGVNYTCLNSVEFVLLQCNTTTNKSELIRLYLISCSNATNISDGYDNIAGGFYCKYACKDHSKHTLADIYTAVTIDEIIKSSFGAILI